MASIMDVRIRRKIIVGHMGPGCIVVFPVLPEQLVDVRQIDRCNERQQLGLQRQIESFYHAVLPWAFVVDSPDLYAHVGQRLFDQGKKK